MTKDRAIFFQNVLDCLRETERSGLASDKGHDVLGGLTGKKTVGALQRLCGLFTDDPGACYLEIGVFQGLTLLSVAVNYPDFPCFGIDNFSLLDPEGKNLGIVQERTKRLGAGNALLINEDFEDALEDIERHLGGRKIGVFFIDGAHDYRSQLIALMLASPYLHERAVILIDDSNYAYVRQSTRDFLITHPDYKMVFEAYTPGHPTNLDAETLKTCEDGWLNGINVLVRDPGGLFPEMLPSIERNRTLFVNEWLVHRHQLAELAPEALRLVQAVCDGEPEGEAARRVELKERHGAMRPVFEKRFKDSNTYSAGLTKARFNRFT